MLTYTRDKLQPLLCLLCMADCHYHQTPVYVYLLVLNVDSKQQNNHQKNKKKMFKFVVLVHFVLKHKFPLASLFYAVKLRTNSFNKSKTMSFLKECQKEKSKNLARDVRHLHYKNTRYRISVENIAYV